MPCCRGRPCPVQPAAIGRSSSPVPTFHRTSERTLSATRHSGARSLKLYANGQAAAVQHILSARDGSVTDVNALGQIDLEGADLLIIENVGNLICPASFQLGVHLNVLIASVPEGDDKPYKYPTMYRGVQAIILNKTDILPYFDFDMDYFRRGVEALNPGLAFFPLSAKTGEGFDAWITWLTAQIEAF